MNPNYFDDLLNHLTSEEKDALYNLLEDFKSNVQNQSSERLLELMLKDIAES